VTTTSELDAEPAGSVAAAVAAMTRALTGAVTEADIDMLSAAMEQIQVRVAVQHGPTGRVTYDATDDHPGQTSGRPGGRGGAVRTVQADMPGSLGTSLAELSDRTGQDMAFLMTTSGWLLCLVVGHPSAGRCLYAENPASGQRRRLTLDRA